MSPRIEHLPVSAPPRADVSLSSGSLHVTPSDGDHATISIDGPAAEQFEVALHGTSLVVSEPRHIGLRWRGHAIAIALPTGSALRARVANGRVRIDSSLRDLDLSGASSDIEVTEPVRADDAGSGDADVVVKTASGDVVVADVTGDLRVQTASGAVSARSVGGAIDVRTASGDVIVRAANGHRVNVKAVSGDVRLGFPPGRVLDLDAQAVSGRTTTEFRPAGAAAAEASEVSVVVRTVSGDITLHSA